jgi:hypothetical protein
MYPAASAPPAAAASNSTSRIAARSTDFIVAT